MPHLLELALRAVRAGRGRWAALGWLALLSVPVAVPEWAPLPQIQLTWFDVYQRALPRERRAEPVTIVDVDARSLGEFGNWPWPRFMLAELIEQIGAGGARAIGLELILSEADPTSPEALIGRLDSAHRSTIDALARMPRYDDMLARTLARHPVVLAVEGLDTQAQSTALDLRTRRIAFPGERIAPSARIYPYSRASLPQLQAAASGQGLVSADLERGLLRRIPLVATIGETPVAAFALELIRVAMGARAVVADGDDEVIRALHVGDLLIPTLADGRIWLHYSAYLPERYVSALDVLTGRADASWFEGKIVIVALTGLGLTDFRATPLGDYVPSVEAQAQVIESFFDGRSLTRPAWMPAAETLTLVVLACVLIAAVPAMRRSLAAFLALAMLLLVAALGFALFAMTGLLFDAASVMLALFAVLLSLFASLLVQADQDRRRSEASLRTERESAAHMAGELEAARRIQLGILPRSETSFADEKRFELAAAIEPARAVGGDLYDFFMLDEHRLFLFIADVSGKGIPASLFMSITKVLTKSIALRARTEPESLLTQANVEISRNNPEALFVTAFAAIVDVRTGEMRYWTAGHDTPLMREDAAIRQLDRSASGPPLCVLAHYRYPEQRTTLAPGTTLVLFTDGVSEAEDASGAQFGKERLARCLAALPADAPAKATLAAIRRDIDAFVGGAPVSDDLALVVWRWLGTADSRSDAER
jgi:serine phosphatase RsbU (regulator of sigma subunit)/CHASE2 domain-containing sensor protein